MSGNGFVVLPSTGRGRRMHECFCKAIAKKKKTPAAASAVAAMAVCALPTSSFQIRAHSSNLACATAATSNLLNSRIQSKTHFPCTTAGGGAGTSDFRLFSASRSSSNSTSSSSSSSSSTEKVGKKEEMIMDMSSNNLGVAVVEEGNQLVRSVSACQGCGKEEMVGGCNGEGRIKGGLGAVPGFGWFPIKAYRPCPAFVDAGGKYRRQGQSLEEVAFGRAGKQDNLDISERLRGDKR